TPDSRPMKLRAAGLSRRSSLHLPHPRPSHHRHRRLVLTSTDQLQAVLPNQSVSRQIKTPKLSSTHDQPPLHNQLTGRIQKPDEDDNFRISHRANVEPRPTVTNLNVRPPPLRVARVDLDEPRCLDHAPGCADLYRLRRLGAAGSVGCNEIHDMRAGHGKDMRGGLTLIRRPVVEEP